jgi:hypothetical protein
MHQVEIDRDSLLPHTYTEALLASSFAQALVEISQTSSPK